MNEARDKFLTEAMLVGTPLEGDIRTEYITECGEIIEVSIYERFSAWGQFGKLWEWAQKQNWWLSFKSDNSTWSSPGCLKDEMINPDRFADAVYKFLDERNL